MNYPLQCYIELTQKCNLQCKHCFANAGINVGNTELTLDDIKDIYEEIKKLGIIYVNISGGEPLLNSQFFEIIDYVSKQEFSTCILTNGVLWGKEELRNLDIADPNRQLTIQISIDGPAEIMKLQRGMSEKQFSKVLQTIGALKKLGFSVTILLVADSITCKYLIETAKYLIFQLNVDGAQIVPLFLSGRAIENKEKLGRFWNDWSNLVQKVTLIKKENKWGEFSKKINIGFFTIYELFIPLKEHNLLIEAKEVWGIDLSDIYQYRKQIRRNFYCEAGVSELAISCNKYLFPCVASIRSAANCGYLGDHFEKMVEVWKTSNVLNNFRINEDISYLSEPCKSCEYKDFCGGGCKLQSIDLYGDLCHIDERCPYVIEYNKNKDNVL